MVDKPGGEYLAVDIGPQPPPLVAMQALGVDGAVDALPSPALGLLGISKQRPAGLLGRGWFWVAYRSVGFTRRAKRLDVPERWVAVELVSLRIAGPWYRIERGLGPAGPDDLRERVVVCWTRDVVTLTKAARSKRTGKRPENTGTWKSERWWWTSGLAGSIPLDTDAETIKALLREDAIMAGRTRKAAVSAAPDDGVTVEATAVVTHPAETDPRFPELTSKPLSSAWCEDVVARLDALDAVGAISTQLREAFDVLWSAPPVGGLGSTPTAEGEWPSFDGALRELEAIVDQTGHPALRVVLDHYAVVKLHARREAPGYDPTCESCTAPAGDPRDEPGHHCYTCRDHDGVHTPTPHGYTECPAHVMDTEARANAAESAVEAMTGPEGEAVIIPPATQVVRELLTELDAYVPVPKRWADVTAADIFVGRKGDLWVVDTPMGARDEFTKGKGTVKVAQGGQTYARDFDPDDTARVLVPAAVEAAHAVLMEHLGASSLLGATEPTEVSA